MAEVFRAKLVAAAGTEKVLCIKRILPKHSENHEFISLFVKEAKISLALTHGNITQVFDFGEVDGVYYLAMEHISGQDLSTVLQRHREVATLLDLPAALHVASEVCKGLQYAHGFTDSSGKTQAVVHRDVTPHNILISYSGEVKLTDFGIALAATKVSDRPEVVRGKACYLSPEQADGSPGTKKSDLFALGAVLYEMLTGERPFEAETETETLNRVRSLQVAPPSEPNSEVDEELDRIVLKALARNPEERYADAGELQVALTQCLHRRWPDYTGQKLAETMKELFAWEMSGGSGSDGEDKLRDRLLFQLSRAGVKVDDRNATTDELLELGTVAIQSATAPSERGRRRWVFGVGVGVVVAALAVVGFAVWPAGSGGKVAHVDATPPRPPRVPEPTDTPSDRQPATRPPIAPQTPPKKVGVAPRKVAYLNCNSWPWSVVYVNGKRLRGNTPHYRVPVFAGRHRIRFVNPELGLSKEVTVTVEAGHTKTVAVSLQQ